MWSGKEAREVVDLRIGIFGGTFDPPHIGHLLLARDAAEVAELDRLIFVPCGNPPHKDSSAVTDANVRLEMVKLATAGDPLFETSDFETACCGVSYTAKTLERLSEMYPKDELCFLVGADSLCSIETWFCPERIFAKAEIIAAMRGGADEEGLYETAKKLKAKYGARIRLVKTNVIEMSSSEIRRRVAHGLTIRYMVPEKVREYIEGHGLYAEKGEK